MEDKLKLLTEKKQRLDKHRPLPPELVKNLEDWFKVELTYSSNAIEGNTLSRIETAEVIERGVTTVISGKPLKDLLEAKNHAQSLEFIKELARARKRRQFISEMDIKAIHKIILTGIDDNSAGKYRRTEVFVRGSNAEFPLPKAVPYAMQEFTQWLQGQQETHPVRVAADAHFKFVSIHPFIDGNGRTARLLMNLILYLHDYPMAVIRNEDRAQYLATFDEARNKKNMRPFYDIVENAVEYSLDVYIRAAKGEQPALFPITQGSKTVTSGKLLKIGELAKETTETIHTLHFWTREGLLTVADYTEGGYQLYSASMIERAKEIRKLQNEERLTIREIKERFENGRY